MIAGLLRPSKGAIRLLGNGDESPDPRRNGAIGVVGHGEWIYEDLTARENLKFFASCTAFGTRPKQPIAGSKPWGWRDSPTSAQTNSPRHAPTPHDSSRPVAQSARPAFGRAWTALDDRAVSLLASLLLDAHSRNCTVVVCSHQLREALQLATDIVPIDAGKVIFQGPNSPDIKQKPDDFYETIS